MNTSLSPVVYLIMTIAKSKHITAKPIYLYNLLLLLLLAAVAAAAAADDDARCFTVLSILSMVFIFLRMY